MPFVCLDAPSRHLTFDTKHGGLYISLDVLASARSNHSLLLDYLIVSVKYSSDRSVAS